MEFIRNDFISLQSLVTINCSVFIMSRLSPRKGAGPSLRSRHCCATTVAQNGPTLRLHLPHFAFLQSVRKHQKDVKGGKKYCKKKEGKSVFAGAD